MRILITGATGFIGRHVVKAIQNNDCKLALFVRNIEQARLLNNPDTVYIKGELGNLDASKPEIRNFSPDICIHLAWEGIPDYSEGISKLNLDNSIDFIDFIVKETDCKKVIISGSCFEYGKTLGECKETDSAHPTSFFAWAKQSIYDYASLLCGQSAMDLIWFRIFYAYGTGQRSGSLIPLVVKKLSEAECPDILNPYNKIDFIYVEDIAEAFRLAVLNNISSGIYNIGSGTSTSVYDVCRTTENLITGQSAISEQLIKSFKKNETTDFWADTGKANQLLGWKSSTPLKQGINKYITELLGRDQP